MKKISDRDIVSERNEEEKMTEVNKRAVTVTETAAAPVEKKTRGRKSDVKAPAE